MSAANREKRRRKTMPKTERAPQRMSDSIYVAVTNYDFSDNADRLAQSFGHHLETVLIDASSPSPPKSPHTTIPNTYYPGLWNAAVGSALEKGFEWLMFVASDVEIGDVERLCRNAVEATTYQTIGIYTPSLTRDSRCYFQGMFNNTTASIRECGVCEGFFFLARTSILKAQFPLDPSRKFGWGVDVASCFEAYQQRKVVAVDDRVVVRHPGRQPQHAVNDDAAAAEVTKFRPPEVQAWLDRVMSEFPGRFNPISISTSLDLGCGRNPQNHFGSNHLYGVDIVQIDHPNIKRADLNIEPIPFDDDTFDYVTASDFIEHVARMLYAPNLRFPFIELMGEIYRVLKPNGVFLSITPAYPDGKAFQDPTHVNFITENTLQDYFCVPNLWAGMYGFSGRFLLLRQSWNDGKLVSFLRAIKD